MYVHVCINLIGTWCCFRGKPQIRKKQSPIAWIWRCCWVLQVCLHPVLKESKTTLNLSVRKSCHWMRFWTFLLIQTLAGIENYPFWDFSPRCMWTQMPLCPLTMMTLLQLWRESEWYSIIHKIILDYVSILIIMIITHIFFTWTFDIFIFIGEYGLCYIYFVPILILCWKEKEVRRF